MKYLFLMLFFSFSAMACWKVEGSLGVDGETYKIEQKIEHNKEYIFPMGVFIFKMKIITGKSKTHSLKYVVEEKKGTTLTLITKGEDEVTEEALKEIFAKGEPNQPNTIITLKLLHN